MDLINKLIPTKIQTVIKVFLISIFPFNLERWAPKNPPVKEPIIKTINKFNGTDPILAKNTAPTKFQKIPTVKNVILMARRKSISKVLINSIQRLLFQAFLVHLLFWPLKRHKIFLYIRQLQKLFQGQQLIRNLEELYYRNQQRKLRS